MYTDSDDISNMYTDIVTDSDDISNTYTDIVTDSDDISNMYTDIVKTHTYAMRWFGGSTPTYINFGLHKSSSNGIFT
jgi:hypothetical protein